MATRNSYSTASDEPVYEADSFELLWEQHKAKIILGIVVVLAVVGGGFGWFFLSSANKAAAAEAFSSATTPEAWAEVIAKYPKSAVAGNAALLLAQSLRNEKKIDEANKVLEDFVAAQPKAQFAPLAKLAVAENQALAGNLDEAGKSLQSISETDADSFVAPFALMMKAELHLAQWQRNDALRTFDLLYTNFPETVSGDSSESLAESLRAMARPVTAKKSTTPAPAAVESSGEEQQPATQP